MIGRSYGVSGWTDCLVPWSAACAVYLAQQGQSTPLGVPPAPWGSALTVPPASGQSAAALQQSLSNQGTASQAAIDASGVQSTWLDQVLGGVYQAGDAAAAAVTPSPSTSLVLLVIGAVALYVVVRAVSR